jgi:aminoglycoside/choline kinase family phosphotransferase
MRWELAGFELWFVGHLAGWQPSPELGRWLDRICERAADHPRRVCHRDYHLNNLFFLADGEVGVIDAQDVLVGPDTYDLASLLYERAMPAIVDHSAREALLLSWADRSGAAPGWRSRLELIRLQRGLKVLGTFGRLVVSGREQYRPWLDSLAVSAAETVEQYEPPPDLLRLLLDWNLG